MCLSIRWGNESTKEWLKTFPDTITAYKVVLEKLHGWMDHKEVISVYPPIRTNTGPYKKTNTISSYDESRAGRINTGSKKGKYQPFFHLFLSETAARTWADEVSVIDGEMVVLKCEIPKDQITTVGNQFSTVRNQSSAAVIVTREFTFVEGDEYFDEKSS